ncbi:glycosyltransferase [Duganella sp. FT134W]|uniref:Glycosyltransferase n=1 Tax=Duganella margarita TaxID=2692170 RepID=A0A7X4H2L2_9BURK|nr:glycosyltransferase family 2 protein [Duganella margarita]MYM74156.1 glycosyltransferase [Duganella margarita]
MTVITEATQVLIVVPTLNEEVMIERVLATLIDGKAPSLQRTFVIADGGSSDATRAIVGRIAATRSDVILMDNPQRRQSAGINLALATHGVGAEVLIRCDAHAEYPAHFVDMLLESLASSQAEAVVIPMDSGGDNCVQRAVAWVSDTPLGSGGSAHRGGRASGFVDHGHHAAFLTSSFRRAGGYDESFSHNEDAELDCRQRAYGSRIFLDTGIRIGYAPRATLAGLWRQYFNYGKGRSRTIRRHPGSMRARQFAVPAHLAFSIFALLVSPWFAYLLAWPLLYLSILAAGSLQIAAKRGSACGLLAGPAAFVMHTAWALGLFWGLLSVRQPRWMPHDTISRAHGAVVSSEKGAAGGRAGQH